jgi:hypothetical protein
MSCEACDGQGRKRLAVCEFAERRGRAVLAGITELATAVVA